MTTPEAQEHNAQKDYSDWVTGDEPITGAQMSYLSTLAQRTGKQFNFDFDNMTKAEAGQRIEELQGEITSSGSSVPEPPTEAP